MKQDKIKVVFMIPSLVAGGAERVFAFVSQNLNSDQFSTELLVMGKSEHTAYSIDKVSVKYLEKSRVMHAIPGILHYLKRNKPDIVLSSIGHLNMVSGVLAVIFPSIKFIIRPTNIESGDVGGWFAKRCFSQVNRIICQSQDMADNFRRLYGTPTESIAIIGNPITNVVPINVKEYIDQTKNFITVGRLNQIKGHTRILKLLARLKKNFHYTIIGDGPEKENLMTQIKDSNLTSKVTHVAYTDKVNEYLVNNDLFLQGSFSEGFPNAVLESCTMGTPALAFNVPGGTKEIINHGKNGFLVENEDEYLSILESEHQWARNDVRNSVLSKFSSEIVLDKYENLLLSVI